MTRQRGTPARARRARGRPRRRGHPLRRVHAQQATVGEADGGCHFIVKVGVAGRIHHLEEARLAL